MQTSKAVSQEKSSDGQIITDKVSISSELYKFFYSVFDQPTPLNHDHNRVSEMMHCDTWHGTF